MPRPVIAEQQCPRLSACIWAPFLQHTESASCTSPPRPKLREVLHRKLRHSVCMMYLQYERRSQNPYYLHVCSFRTSFDFPCGTGRILSNTFHDRPVYSAAESSKALEGRHVENWPIESSAPSGLSVSSPMVAAQVHFRPPERCRTGCGRQDWWPPVKGFCGTDAVPLIVGAV